MPSDPPSPVPASRPSDTATPQPTVSAPSLGTLARKIRGRTTDLVAIGVVLIAGLTFGRQVLHWWGVDEVRSPTESVSGTAATTAVWGDSGGPVDLQFGEFPLGFTRQAIRGPLADVQRQLLTLCAEKTRNASIPESPAQPSELRMLERLASATPVMKESGRWEVYQYQQPMPLVLGVRNAPTTSVLRTPGVEAGTRRVVCWGWLVPRGQTSYTAYCVQAVGVIRSERGTSLEMPLPLGSRRTLSVRGTREGELITFTGPGPADAWRDFYDGWGRKQGHGPLQWQQVGTSWSARFRDLSTSREMTWHFAPNSQGQGSSDWLGIIDMIPIREPRGNP